MKRSFAILAVAAALLSVSCEKEEVNKLEIQPLTHLSPMRLDLTKSQAEMTVGINDFAYDMYREVYEDKDVFISPFSMSLALSMLTTGADGNTAGQLLSALGFEGKTTEDLDTYYSAVMKNMTKSDPTTSLSIANAIWTDKDIVLKSQFIDECQNSFDSAAASVDFSDSKTLDILNDWTYEHTGGKIEKMYEKLPSGTAAVLANALDFKATWPFDFLRSKDRLLARVTTTYYEGDGFTAVQLPYGNGTFAMRIIQPKKGTSLKSMVERLDGEFFNYATLETAIVSVDIPVFSFSYENHLNDALKSLGVTDAYSPSMADFSKMSDDQLYVSDVLHKTFVDVNEKGTEASAITAINYLVGASGKEQLPREVEFKVTRDFVFEIIDRSTGLIVFIGQHKI